MVYVTLVPAHALAPGCVLNVGVGGEFTVTVAKDPIKFVVLTPSAVEVTDTRE